MATKEGRLYARIKKSGPDGGAKPHVVRVPKTKRYARSYVEVTTRNVHGRYSNFYSPAYHIAQQIKDSLDPDKARTPGTCEEVVHSPSSGFRFSVSRKLERRRSDQKYAWFVLSNGRKMLVYDTDLIEEGVGYVRVKKLGRGLRPDKLPSKFGGKCLCKEAARHAILQRRNG